MLCPWKRSLSKRFSKWSWTCQMIKLQVPTASWPKFYKSCWKFLGQDVWQVVENSRFTASLLTTFNASLISLLPKSSTASSPVDYHSIALCSVIYKIISKTFANRLKLLLPSIISPEQTSYVEGRQILDSLILAQEHIHSLWSSKQPDMVLKLDMSKAFDKVSW